MNSFQRFGINHLSASSLNKWRTAPGLWALHYIANIKDEGNASMWRGTAVENGFAALLRTRDFDQAAQVALTNFDINSQGETSDEIDEERELICPMLRACLHWPAPSNLAATQLRVEHWFDPVPVPIVGYLDFSFEDGTDVDLKTTKRIPSLPAATHVRQVALYRTARNRKGGLLYVSDKRHSYYDVDDQMMEAALGDMCSDAQSLNNFLARCESKKDVLKSLPLDWENFRAPKIKVPLSHILLAG